MTDTELHAMIAGRSGSPVDLGTASDFWRLAPDERILTATGDSLTALCSVPSDYVDAVVTDGPFSSGGMFRGDRAQSTSTKYVRNGVVSAGLDFCGDTRDQKSFMHWASLVFAECHRIVRQGGVLCAFSDWRQLGATQDAMQAGGFVMRGVVVWDKTEASRPRIGGFRSQCEFIVWGSRGPLHERNDVGCLDGCFRFRRNHGEDRIHQTGKPVPLMESLVRICPPGGIVLDPFMGSGSTGIGCVHTGRRFIGIEISAAIELQARSRLSGATENRLPGVTATQGALFAASVEASEDGNMVEEA